MSGAVEHHIGPDFKGVAFRLEYFDYFRDFTVALMLSQIHYWYMPNKEGKSKLQVQRDGNWYLVKSHREWYNETRLSRHQVTRALAILEQAGIIRTKVLGFAGTPVVHIIAIMAEGNRPLKKGEFLVPIADSSYNPLYGQGAIHCTVSAQSNTESTTETTTEINPLALQETAPQKGQEIDSLSPGEDMAKGPSSTSQILAMHKAGMSPDKKVKTVIDRALEIWRTIPKFNDTVKFVPELTLKQKGQLKMVMKAFGTDDSEILTYCVQNWMAYCQFVRTQTGLKNVPDAPQIGFLLKYAGEARSYWVGKKSVQLIAPKKVQEEKPEKAPPQKKDGGDDQISLEDFLAL